MEFHFCLLWSIWYYRSYVLAEECDKSKIFKSTIHLHERNNKNSTTSPTEYLMKLFYQDSGQGVEEAACLQKHVVLQTITQSSLPWSSIRGPQGPFTLCVDLAMISADDRKQQIRYSGNTRLKLKSMTLLIKRHTLNHSVCVSKCNIQDTAFIRIEGPGAKTKFWWGASF